MSEELDNLKSMSLGDHLEELRGRLILMLLGVFIGLAVCLCFGKFFVRTLQIPYNNAIQNLHESEVIDPNEPATADKESEEPKEPEKTYTLTPAMEMLQEQIDDLRTDVDILTGKVHEVPLTSMAPSETFKIYLKVSLLFGVLFSSPWVIWQIWAFVSSGLYKKEKQFAHAIAPASTILFLTGALFFMFVVAPLVMEFFVKFDRMFDVQTKWTLLNYVNMVLTLTLVFGAAFQMPIVIVFAEKIGLVKIEQLTSGRKFVILGIVILAAVATPPDIISQISLAVPLYGLYEGSILVCRFLRMRRNKNSK